MSSSFSSKIKRIPGTLKYKYEEIDLGFLTNRIKEKYSLHDNRIEITLIYIFDNGYINFTGKNIYFFPS